MRLFWLSVLALLAFAVPAEARSGAGGEPVWRSADGHPYAAVGRAPTALEGVAAGRGNDLRLEQPRPSHARLRAPHPERALHPLPLPSRAEPLRPYAERLPYDANAPPTAA